MRLSLSFAQSFRDKEERRREKETSVFLSVLGDRACFFLYSGGSQRKRQRDLLRAKGRRISLSELRRAAEQAARSVSRKLFPR
jgi:hypothetical protein